MREAFIKSLKWLSVVIFVIGGVACLHYADQSKSVKPVLPGIVCLGIAFIFGSLYKDLRQKILFVSIIFTAAMAFAAQYANAGVYLTLGRIVDINFFLAWAGLAFIPGIPFMMYIFYKYGD